MLNSERIKYLFGSYGVDIIHQTDELRISNLHSLEQDIPIMRTCAMITYAQPHELTNNAHEKIVAGGSIGTCLKKAGFKITKNPIYFGETKLSKTVCSEMAVKEQKAAVHMYDLVVSKDGKEIPYCTITEIHSPNYMPTKLLKAIYAKDYEKHSKKTKPVTSILDKLDTLDGYIEQHNSQKDNDKQLCI